MRAALAEAEASTRTDANADTFERRRRANGDSGGASGLGAILGLVSLLAGDFAAHENPNRRKGGLLGLAAVVVGLGEDAGGVVERRETSRAALRAAVPPILAAFSDPEPRVRYYACEAMYNVLKTARAGVLLLPEREDDEGSHATRDGETDEDALDAGSLAFPTMRALFDASCDLSADADADVQNAAHLLDGLCKDVVSEAFHDADDASDDDSEEVRGGTSALLSACLTSAIRARAERAAPASRLRRAAAARSADPEDPYARQFLIGWIVVLDATPQVDALFWLPEFFEPLLRMLSDPNREIRQQADGCLRTFLSEIRALFEATDADGDQPRARFSRVDLARLSSTLERHTRSADEFTRVTAVTWLREFVALAGRAGRGKGFGGDGKTKAFARIAEMTRAVLPCLSHAEAKVRDVAARAADELLEAARDAAAAKTLDLDALLAALAACAGAAAEASRAADVDAATAAPILSAGGSSRLDAVAGEATRAEALRWFLALLETAPEETRARMLGVAASDASAPRREKRETAVENTREGFFHSDALASVFLNVSSDSELATRRATDALARLGEGSDGAFDAVVRALARALFEDERARRVRARGSAREHRAGRISRADGEAADVDGTERTASSETSPSAATDTSLPRSFLERRGLATIRRLCAALGDARVVRRLAEVVAETAASAIEKAGSPEEALDGGGGDDDGDALAFAARAADALNAIALAAPECARLRRTLRGDDDAFAFGRDTIGGDSSPSTESAKSRKEKESLLRGLFPCWCHSPAATIGLCVLSGLDAVAFFCAEEVARDETELSRETLVRLDRLAHLLETPPFAGARLRLVAPGARPGLKRALAAVLALLPQSSAFRLLRDRLGGCALVGGSGARGGRSEGLKTFEKTHPETPEGGMLDETVPPFAARAFRAARAAHARERERTSNETSRLRVD